MKYHKPVHWRKTISKLRTSHGESNAGGRKVRTVEYVAWINMKQRCSSLTGKEFRDYGSRGITVCRRWLVSFHNFLRDMGRRPKGKTLDRKNNDRGYSPQNCRWATPAEQANNRRPAAWLMTK